MKGDEFEDEFLRALESRLEAHRRALDRFQAALPAGSPATGDARRTEPVVELLREVERADDAYDRALADAAVAFRQRFEAPPGEAESDGDLSAPASTEQYHRSVLDGAHEAFVAMDAGGFVIDWNTAAQRVFGWSREEAVGRVLADLIIPPAHRDAHLEGLKRHLASGPSPMLDRRLELRAARRDGSEFPAEVTIARLPEPGPARFCAFLREIEEHDER